MEPEYGAWLERVGATYAAVAYTCGHRLGDAELGRRVSAAVVAGLIARPGVFRYQGLPYSGRIAALAEGLLAAAREGRPPAGPEWPRIRAALHAVPGEMQEVFVLSCVHGYRPCEMATRLGCAPGEASQRYEQVLTTMRDIGAPED